MYAHSLSRDAGRGGEGMKKREMPNSVNPNFIIHFNHFDTDRLWAWYIFVA